MAIIDLFTHCASVVCVWVCVDRMLSCTPDNFKKKGEHIFKSVKYDSTLISAIAPTPCECVYARAHTASCRAASQTAFDFKSSSRAFYSDTQTDKPIR
jgi:hypothetical protein